jgi:thiamine-phosphate pyrophosphorylase
LYAITPDWNDTKRLLKVTEAILDAGCRVLQYRNKQTSDCHRQEQAVALRGLTRKYSARLIINDDVDLALFCDADGVHLGEDDGQLAAARRGWMPRARQKSSALRVTRACRWRWLQPKPGRITSPSAAFFASPTKPQAKRADPALIAAAKSETGLPVCAIGGITLDNAESLIAAGADLLAVISALYDAPDPHQAALNFTQLFKT